MLNISQQFIAKNEAARRQASLASVFNELYSKETATMDEGGKIIFHDNDTTPKTIQSDGGPSEYYDFDSGWKTWNDFADYKAKHQWKEHSFHLGNIGKSICRWGDKGGTSKEYDTRKIIYSGLRILLMLKGKEAVRTYLKNLLDDPQFK